jgi:tripartite-type tricarboxylate transporter receptor subunit TctC
MTTSTGRRFRWAAGVTTTLFLLSSHFGPARSETAEQFYRGKTVTLQIGYVPGGGYDLYARQLARYYGRHLAGQPTVVTQNVPGAGSLKLANQIYNAAPRDGTTIAAIGREQVTAKLFGVAGVQFEATRMNWIGNMDQAASLCVAWYTGPIKTMADARKHEMAVGATGPASTTLTLPAALDQLLGYKFKIISGYPGGGEITLALERGEVQGRCSWSYASIVGTRPDWIRDKKIRFLSVAAVRRLPELPDVPTIYELAPKEQDKQVLALIMASDDIARPFVAPPNVPPERLQALRDAFSATMHDPQFLAEAKKQELELDPMDWRDMTETIEKLYASPRSVVKAATDIIQRAGH